MEKFLIGIIFIVLGLIYAMEPCDFPVILILLLRGTILVSQRIIHLLNVPDFFDNFLAVLETTTMIWSAYTIASEYSHWQHTNPDLPGFCPYLPYQALVIYLILHYVVNGIVLLLLLVMVIRILLCLCYQRFATFLNRYCRFLTNF